MAPGNFNGTNYSCGHTGSGKKRNSSVYSLGYYDKRVPNKMFTVGKHVYNVKTGEYGILKEKIKFKSSRSIVLFGGQNKSYYILTKNIRLKKEKVENKQNRNIQSKRNNSKIYNKDKIEQSKRDKQAFRKKKQQINQLLLDINKNNRILSQDGSSRNMIPWIANKHDFYEFVEKNDEQSIKLLFRKRKLLKEFLIDKISQNYINKYVDKIETITDHDKFKIIIDEKKSKYKKELQNKSMNELKRMVDFKKEEFECLDENPIELEYQLT